MSGGQPDRRNCKIFRPISPEDGPGVASPNSADGSVPLLKYVRLLFACISAPNGNGPRLLSDDYAPAVNGMCKTLRVNFALLPASDCTLRIRAVQSKQMASRPSQVRSAQPTDGLPRASYRTKCMVAHLLVRGSQPRSSLVSGSPASRLKDFSLVRQ